MRIDMSPDRLLTSANLKITAPRLRILGYFQTHPGHYTPEELYQALRVQKDPVNLSTLYANLRILCDHGILRLMKDRSGLTRFDSNSDPHDHLYCRACGRLEDLVMDLGLDRQEAVRTKTEWLISRHETTFEGICPSCQSKDDTFPSGKETCL